MTNTQTTSPSGGITISNVPDTLTALDIYRLPVQIYEGKFGKSKQLLEVAAVGDEIVAYATGGKGLQSRVTRMRAGETALKNKTRAMVVGGLCQSDPNDKSDNPKLRGESRMVVLYPMVIVEADKFADGVSPEQARDLVAAHPSCLAAWLSISGTGIAAIFIVAQSDDVDYLPRIVSNTAARRAYKLARFAPAQKAVDEALSVIGELADDSQRNLERLRFGSWDPGLKRKPDDYVITPLRFDVPDLSDEALKPAARKGASGAPKRASLPLAKDANDVLARFEAAGYIRVDDRVYATAELCHQASGPGASESDPSVHIEDREDGTIMMWCYRCQDFVDANAAKILGIRLPRKHGGKREGAGRPQVDYAERADAKHAAALGGRKPETDHLSWQISMRGGLLQSSPSNAAKAIDGLGKYGGYRYNAFAQAIERADGELFQMDAEMRETRTDIESAYEYTPTREALAEAIEIAAHAHEYNPVTAWFDGLAEWDRNDRFADGAARYLGCDDGELADEYLRLIFKGVISRAYTPGIRFGYIPIIVGAQGLGKSTFCEILSLADVLGDDELFLDDADFTSPQHRKILQETLPGVLLLEIPEFQAMGDSALAAFKKMATGRKFKGRLAYAHSASTMLLSCVAIATTNDASPLTDTAHRRNPVVHCTRALNLDALKADLPLLYAQAIHEWREDGAGEVKLPSGLWADANAASDDFVMVTDYQAWLENALKSRDAISNVELNTLRQDADSGFKGPYTDKLRVKTLARLGFTNRNADGTAVWVNRSRGWRRIGVAPKPAPKTPTPTPSAPERTAAEIKRAELIQRKAQSNGRATESPQARANGAAISNPIPARESRLETPVAGAQDYAARNGATSYTPQGLPTRAAGLVADATPRATTPVDPLDELACDKCGERRTRRCRDTRACLERQAAKKN